MKKIIVLGSSGFIGKQIVKKLLDSSCSVIGVDIVADTISNHQNFLFFQSPINTSILSKVLSEHSISIVVHAAGKASVPASFADPGADFIENTVSVFTILTAIHKFSVTSKLILLSSAAVYGNPVKLPITEDDPLNPISPYGFHKLQSEIIAREFYTCFNISTTIIRIFSCYGAGQQKLFLWDLCNKARLKKDIILKGCGNESRDFVHVNDVASCVNHLIKRDISGFEIFNLASGKEYSIKDTAELLVNNLSNNNTIHFEGKKNTGNPDNWVADIGKLNETGFVPSVAFEKGIEAYVEWFKSVS